MKRKRPIVLSVSNIVAIKYDPARILYRNYSRGMSTGSRLHQELGFTNRQPLSKIVDGVIIRGIPDRISNNLIEDLKTYYTKESRDYYESLARCQCNIYCFLADSPRYKIHFYHVPSQTTEIVEGKADPKQALKDIRYAIKVWKKLLKVLGLNAS